jgi:beta-galactosidase
MRIGADYYPEHWDRERWSTDFKLMNDAGIKVVRIGEFTWSLYEPEEGHFEFGWMDDALECLNQYGIKVVLCTPSATPPKWMIDKYPDILPKDIYGKTKGFGTRKHYCFNSDIYRKKCHILNQKIAERYGHHPAVEAWQVDNELGWANTTRCYCDNCQKKFREYLREKYKTINALNNAYGTVVWSQIYRNFDEIMIPRAGVCYDSDHNTQGQNPGLLLDYYRFASDSVVSFTKESCDDIRKYSDYPVTTNMLDAAVNSGTGIDYFRLSKQLDFTAWDNYIEFQWGCAASETVSRDHALARGYKHQPFWVMEQQVGACGWSKMGPTPTPGKIRLWTYQSVANGADTVVYFRWRSALNGLEQYWNGILDHDGVPGRRYQEVKQIGNEMETLNKEVGTLTPVSHVAIVKSYDSEWSHAIHCHVEGFQYDKYELDFYRAFYQLGITCDFVAPSDDLESYDLVIAPALIISSDEEQENIKAYVSSGGNLLLTFRSGVKTETNSTLPEKAPGPFSDITGISVEEYDPQFEKKNSVSGVFGKGSVQLWCDVINPEGTCILGEYINDYYTGKPCFTVNQYGKGRAYYLGCDLDENAMRNLAKYLTDTCNIPGAEILDPGMEKVDVTDGKEQYRFVLNHNPYVTYYKVTEHCKDLISDKSENGVLRLDPYGVALLKADNN